MLAVHGKCLPLSAHQVLAISLSVLGGLQGGCTPSSDVTGDLDLGGPKHLLDWPPAGELDLTISSESGLLAPTLSKSPGSEPAVAC
jgi:hypothetical protein